MKKMMKFLLTILLVVSALADSIRAQDSKVLAEILKSSEKIVKGAPFSAEAINESVQLLADGNRIARRTTTRMYRDSEGRFRRDEMPNPGGVLGSVVEFPQTLFILDPVEGVKFYLNPASKTARQAVLKTGVNSDFNRQLKSDFNYQLKNEIENKKAIEQENKKIIQNEKDEKEKSVNPKQISLEKQKEIEKMMAEKNARIATQKEKNGTAQAEISANRAEASAKRAEANAKRAAMNANRAQNKSLDLQESTNSKMDSSPFFPTNSFFPEGAKTESLGVKTIEGVEATGTRTTSTIPAGTIGNERPIEIVYERWYSKDLQLIIFSKHSDPRFGEQTYKLTNINRNEPDRSLFSLPADYKLVNPFPPKPIAPPQKPLPPPKEKP